MWRSGMKSDSMPRSYRTAVDRPGPAGFASVRNVQFRLSVDRLPRASQSYTLLPKMRGSTEAARMRRTLLWEGKSGLHSQSCPFGRESREDPAQ
jgi:hypothetical protein